jgi:uncharacterized membrane protein HdeD (DUF308 family)
MSVNVPEKMYKESPWWVTLIEGIVAMIVGGLLLANTSGTVTFLVQLLGIFWLVGGILAIVSIFVAHTGIHWIWSLLAGIIGIVAGILVIMYPQGSAQIVTRTLLILLGIYGLIKGVVYLVQAFKGGGCNSIILGVFSLLIGAIILFSPMLSARLLVNMIGLVFLLGGLMMVGYSLLKEVFDFF